MNDTFVTLAGNVVTDVNQTTTPSGIETASFRLATTPRRYDKGISAWVDGDTSYVRVTCWRRMARHVGESVRKGEPVVVHGTMRVREWEDKDGVRRTNVEIEAHSIGHDLARGTTTFQRPPKREGSMGAEGVEAPTAPQDPSGQDQVAA